MIARVLAGRWAVEAYRVSHGKLHLRPWYQGIHDDHTYLRELMLDHLKGAGFEDIQDFFDANRVSVDAEYSKMYTRSGECTHCGKCCVGCKHHGEATCDIYETRPQNCRDYPTGRHFVKELSDKCGYIFTRTEHMPELDLEWM